MVPKLETIELTKVFRKVPERIFIPALEGISIGVFPGQFVSIVGPSGCGKTTFLRIVAGLLPPTSGTVLLDGQRVLGTGRNRGFVFQKPSLWPWRTVWKNVFFGLEVRGENTGDDAKKRVRDILDLVGLTGFEEHYPHELSGGMQQRVNLARALVLDPEVLLMDEPFAALDAQTREIMQDELLRIWSRTRKTVLLVTHYIDEAVYLSDQVIVFSSRPGRVREDLTIEISRPRASRMKHEAAFGRYVERIWGLIKEEVEASMQFTTRRSPFGRDER